MNVEASHERIERATKNQALCRDVNDRIEELSQEFGAATSFQSFICECADDGCTERVEMTVAEYEALRTAPTCFATVASDEHVFANVEDVVQKLDRYWVVRKRGAAAEIATQLDPRSR